MPAPDPFYAQFLSWFGVNHAEWGGLIRLRFSSAAEGSAESKKMRQGAAGARLRRMRRRKKKKEKKEEEEFLSASSCWCFLVSWINGLAFDFSILNGA